MTLGPLEYLIVGFEGNRFTGQIFRNFALLERKASSAWLICALSRKMIRAMSWRLN